MDTVRVDICYRPLRIAWAIKAGDMDALRSAVHVSFALWGGRFNPIVVVDQEKLAQEVIDAFRVDVILPLCESDEVKLFPKKFPHLSKERSTGQSRFLTGLGARFGMTSH